MILNAPDCPDINYFYSGMKRISILFAALILAAFIHAQDEPPIVTDRPDQTESALVVPAKLLDIHRKDTNFEELINWINS